MSAILCSMLETVALRAKKADTFQIQPLDGGTTPDSKWDWLEVESGDIRDCKTHNHNLKRVCSIPVLTNITKLHRPFEIF